MSKYGVISGPNTGKYGPEITPYLNALYAVNNITTFFDEYIKVNGLIYIVIGTYRFC